jgi:hypothetical protein
VQIQATDEFLNTDVGLCQAAVLDSSFKGIGFDSRSGPGYFLIFPTYVQTLQ